MNNLNNKSINKSLNISKSSNKLYNNYNNSSFNIKIDINKNKLTQETKHLIKLIDRTSEIYKELIAKNINCSSAYKLPEKLNTLTKSLSKDAHRLKYQETSAKTNLEPLGSNEEKLKMLSLMSICRRTLTSRLSSQYRSQFKQTSDFSEECHLKLNKNEKVWSNMRNRVSGVCGGEFDYDKENKDFSCKWKVVGRFSKGRSYRKNSGFCGKDNGNDGCIRKLNFNFDENNINNHNNFDEDEKYKNENEFNFCNNNANYFAQKKNENQNSNLFNNINNNNSIYKGEKATAQNTNRNFISYLSLGDSKNLSNNDNNNKSNNKKFFYKKLSSNLFHGQNDNNKHKSNFTESEIKEDLEENAVESYKSKKEEKSAIIKINNFKTFFFSNKKNFEKIKNEEPENPKIINSEEELDSFRPLNNKYKDKYVENRLDAEGCSRLGKSSTINNSFAENDKSSLFLMKMKKNENIKIIKNEKIKNEENKFNMHSSLISNVNLNLKRNVANERISNYLNSKKRRSINSIILKRKVNYNSPKKARKNMHNYPMSPRKCNSRSYVKKTYISNSFKIKNYFYSYDKEDKNNITKNNSSNFNNFDNPFINNNNYIKYHEHPNIKIQLENNSNKNTKFPYFSNKQNIRTLKPFPKIKSINKNKKKLISNSNYNPNSITNKISNHTNKNDIYTNSSSSLSLSKSFCRICKEDDNEPGNSLISICNCTKFMQYMHISCSSKFIRDMNNFKENSFTCEICQKRYLYFIEKKYHWRALKHSLKFIRFVVKLVTLVFIAVVIKYLFPVLGFNIVDEFVNNIIFWTVFFLIVSLVYYYSGILGFDILETWTFFDNSAIKDYEEEQRIFLLDKGLNNETNGFKKSLIIREENFENENDQEKKNENENKNEVNDHCFNTVREIDYYDIISPERKHLRKSYLKNNNTNNICCSDKLFENARTHDKTEASVSIRKSKSASPNKKKLKSILQSIQLELFSANDPQLCNNSCEEKNLTKSNPKKDSLIKSFRSNSILRIRFKNEFIATKQEAQNEISENTENTNFQIYPQENEELNNVIRIKNLLPKKTSLFEHAQIQKQKLFAEKINLLDSNKSKKSEFNLTLKAIGCTSPSNSNSKSFDECQAESKSDSFNCSLPNDEFNFENLIAFKNSFNMLSGFNNVNNNNNLDENYGNFIKDNKQLIFSPKVKSSFLKSRKNNLFKYSNNDTSTHKQVFMNVKADNSQEISFSFDNNNNYIIEKKMKEIL